MLSSGKVVFKIVVKFSMYLFHVIAVIGLRHGFSIQEFKACYLSDNFKAIVSKLTLRWNTGGGVMICWKVLFLINMRIFLMI